jgi:hypothetical protein
MSNTMKRSVARSLLLMGLCWLGLSGCSDAVYAPSRLLWGLDCRPAVATDGYCKPVGQAGAKR